MKNNFVVLGIGNSGRRFPLAISKNHSKAIGYADMCAIETSVKPCSDIEVLKYMESFYILNLD